MIVCSTTFVLILGLIGLTRAVLTRKTAEDFDLYIETFGYSTPVTYTNNADKEWVITADNSDRNVKATIDTDIQNCASCSCDYLKVYDGQNSGGTLLGTYCGTQSGVKLTSTGDSLYVRFISDGSTVANGFRLTFSQTEADLLVVWIIVGVLMGIAVLVGMVSIILACFCGICKKKTTANVTPELHVHYHAGQVPGPAMYVAGPSQPASGELPPAYTAAGNTKTSKPTQPPGPEKPGLGTNFVEPDGDIPLPSALN